MKIRKFILPFCFILLLFLAGCNASESDISTEFAVQDSKQADTSTANSGEVEQIQEEMQTLEESNNHTERKIIYHASLSLEVKNYEQVEAELEQKVQDIKGYVVDSSVYNNGAELISGNITVKVPQESLQSFLNDVEGIGIKLIDKSISGNDVTEEYIDLESRLKAKTAVETRLLTLLDQAEKTEDLLKISADLATVQEEKEQIIGRMNYIKNHVDYSTVTINLQENLIDIGDINKQGDFNTWDKAKSLFVDTINSILSFFSHFIIFIIGLSPILIPLIIIAIIWIVIRKRKKNE